MNNFTFGERNEKLKWNHIWWISFDAKMLSSTSIYYKPDQNSTA